MLVITYIIIIILYIFYYIITQWGHSPKDLAHTCNKHEVVKTLEREEKKLRK